MLRVAVLKAEDLNVPRTKLRDTEAMAGIQCLIMWDFKKKATGLNSR